jgi:hypothetical protein
VTVEVAQCGADTPAVIHRPGELAGTASWLACFVFDPSTVLAGNFAPYPPAISPSDPKRRGTAVPAG